MTPDRWLQVSSLFSEALRRQPPERIAWLNDACAADETMRVEVERLLAAHEDAGRFFDQAAADLIPTATVDGPGFLAGRALNQYKINSLVAVGAMGEVYRAHDSRLDRDVAVKVLPAAVAGDPGRIARFEREAKALAAVNHPNIAQIYGFEDCGDRLAIVMELVDGPTLAERLEAGPIPCEEALRIAAGIAEALAAAHDRGIVHRDLKPANIKIRHDGVVKVLDFGLAKASSAGVPRDELASANVTVGSTRVGAVLGTAPYMSPEQARGEPVDSRTDIWAFGCVLFEMLTGAAAFPGASVADVLGAVLEREPDWKRLPAGTPLDVRRLLRRCLEKDLSRRIANIDEARSALGSSLRQSGRNAKVWPVVVAATTGVAIAAMIVVTNRRKEAVTSPAEYRQLTAFAESALAPNLSPDGRMVTFKVGSDFFLGRGDIYVKVLPDGESVRLTNDHAQVYGPVFTPDGMRVTYTRFSATPDGSSWDTWTVPVLGGKPARLLPNASGLTWIADRRVMFAEIASGLHMGIVTAAETRADSRTVYFPAHEDAMAHYAALSPDGKSVLIVEMDQTHAFGIPCRLAPFDGSSRGRTVGPQGTCTAAAWSPDGRWMYFGVTMDGAAHLWRQRYPSGAPEQITSGPTEEEGVTLAPDGGSLITSLGTRQSAIWIHDAAGERPVTTEGYATRPLLSRDGSRLFYLVRPNAGVASSELRVIELPTGTTQTLLPGITIRDYDVSADERTVAFTSGNGGVSQLWVAPVDRRTAPRLIATAADQPSFTPDGDVVFRSLENATNRLVRIAPDGRRRERIDTPAFQEKGPVSPDGRWVILFGPDARGPLGTAVTWAVPLSGGVPKVICVPYCGTAWSATDRFFYLAVNLSPTTGAPSRTVAIPLDPGHALPSLPDTGVDAGGRINIPGAAVINHGVIAPGPNPSVYAFTKSELHRNLFQIPLH